MRGTGPLTFVDAAPSRAVASGTGARPSLGTIPDMASEPGGVLLQGVRAGSAAETAGMRAGDVLVGMGEYTIAKPGGLPERAVALQGRRPRRRPCPPRRPDADAPRHAGRTLAEPSTTTPEAPRRWNAPAP